MDIGKGLAGQIQRLVKQQGLTIEQAATALRIPVEQAIAHMVIQTEVKGAVVRGAEVREMVAQHRTTAVDVIAEMMQNDEFPHLKLKAAMFMLEYDAGKHDGAAASKEQGMNITTINNILVKGQDVYEETIREFDNKQKKLVEVNV